MNPWKILSVFALLAAVSCERPGEETAFTPEITILNDNPIIVPDEGGGMTISCRVTGGEGGGEISAAISADWISYLSVDYDSMEVFFEIEENASTESRNAEIAILYTSVAGKWQAGDTVSVVQEGMPENFDYVFEAEYFTGEYFGIQYGNNGEANYSMILADAPGSGQNLTPGGVYYVFDFFSTEPLDMNGIKLPEGTYSFGAAGETASMTFTPEYSYWFKVNGNGTGYEIPVSYFTGGTVAVSYEGDKCDIEAELVDGDGKTHKVSYGGDGLFSNGLIESSLTGDVEVDCSGMAVEAIFYGDYYMNLTTDWYIVMASPSGEVLQLDICAEEGGSIADGLPSGVFTASTAEFGANEGEFVPGYVDGAYQSCWYYNEDDRGNITDPLAPLMSGEIEITSNADGTYTIKVDCGDDASAPNRITAHWTGTPSYSDESFLFSVVKPVYDPVGKAYHRNVNVVR